MKNRILSVALISCLVIISSCKKEIEEPVNEATNPAPSTLNGVWIEGDWQVMTTSGIDTTMTYGEYVGDGYNNGVTTVNVTSNGYLVNDTINIDGNDYLITDYTPNGSGLDTNYRYYVESKIITPFEGCKFYLDIFKRQND